MVLVLKLMMMHLVLPCGLVLLYDAPMCESLSHGRGLLCQL
jgi:hypothetical protein